MCPVKELTTKQTHKPQMDLWAHEMCGINMDSGVSFTQMPLLSISFNSFSY